MDEEFDQIPAGEKICPLMNGFYKGVLCTPDCALHRANKKDNECILNELQSISFFLKKQAEKDDDHNK